MKTQTKAILPKQLNRKIGQALHDYNMLSNGDRVLVAVSGGVDSLVSAFILHMWQAKAPITYSLEAVFIDNGFWEPEASGDVPAKRIGRQMKRFEIPFSVVQGWPLKEEEKRACFTCARNRRTQLFDLAREKNCNKLAFGHHKDDLVETFFLNTLYSGNVSTMLPRQDLFGGKLSLIRILSYIDKNDVIAIAELFGIEPVANSCPLAGDTRRETVRDILEGIYNKIPGAKSSVFSALGNVRDGYML